MKVDTMSTPMGMPRSKRVAPPEVKPVTIRGVRFEAVHWGRSRGLGQNGGFIAAIDSSSGRELWVLKVYDITYDPAMEQDVQDVFIERMRAENGKLIVTDEDGRRYVVDVKRRRALQR
jgi:outer membrane protein assembly factor BamB